MMECGGLWSTQSLVLPRMASEAVLKRRGRFGFSGSALGFEVGGGRGYWFRAVGAAQF